MRKKRKRPGDNKNTTNRLFIAYSLLIIGGFFSLLASVYFLAYCSEYTGGYMVTGVFLPTGMGASEPYYELAFSNEPCMIIAIILSVLVIGLGFIGYHAKNDELGLLASILLIIMLQMPSVVIGTICFLLFFKYGFE